MGLVMVFSRLPIIRIHLVYKNRFKFPPPHTLSFSLIRSFCFIARIFALSFIRFVFVFPFGFESFFLGYGIVYNLFSVVSFSKFLVSHTPTFCWFCRFSLFVLWVKEIPKPILYLFVCTNAKSFLVFCQDLLQFQFV